jgi:hypothetical protein
MSKSGGVKAASLFVGLLLCMVIIQTAIAQTEGNAAVMLSSPMTTGSAQMATGNAQMTTGSAQMMIESAPIESATSIIDPQMYNTFLIAGGGTHFTLSFTNNESEALVLAPKVVGVPNNEKNVDKSWIKISPANATVAAGEKQKFDVEISIPAETQSGSYQGNIAFTDDLVPNSTQYVNSMHLDLAVQSLSKIQLETQYISDTLDAGKNYEYKIKIKNVASKDITIDPKIPEFSSFYDPSYIPAFKSDSIEISAPSTIKAGETANMTIRVKVPENATGRYSGSIAMNVDGEASSDNMNNPQLGLDFTVLKQPLVPYVKTFKTANEKPITVDFSAYTNVNPYLQSPKREKPSFELKLSCNNNPVDMTFVKSVESGTVNIGGGYPQVWPMNDETVYQSFGDSYVETYKVPGAAGNWELSILPKNVQSFGYSITVGDSNYSKP